LQELSQLSHNNDDHFYLSSPTPLSKCRPLEDYKKKDKTIDYDDADEDAPCPLIQGRCAVSDPESDIEDEPPPFGKRIYCDSSSDDDSDDDDGSTCLTRHEDDEDGTVHCSPQVVQRRNTRRALIKHALIEAVRLRN
jgi:hypothetical protein